VTYDAGFFIEKDANVMKNIFMVAAKQ